ncbi:MAG: ATP-dependent DNA helicase RecG [Mycobacteriales bacterium]
MGDRTAAVLSSALGLETVGDLLHHYPRRYAERGTLTDLAHLVVGEHVTVLARVKKARTRPMRDRRRSMLEVVVTDGKRELTLTFFNQAWRAKELVPETVGLFAGKVTDFRGRRQLTHPEYQLLDSDAVDADVATEFAGALIPVYPASERTPSWVIARSVRIVLDTLDDVEDPLPVEVCARHGLAELAQALRLVHRPESRDDVAVARRRLKWDEAFMLQVALAQRRHAARATPTPPRVRRAGGLADAFDAALPFELTAGQQEVSGAIEADLAATHPMHRLLQGEVGSGKTVVAIRAMLTVIDAGGQAALMAPTEVLAAQHARNIRELLGPLAMAGELGGADQATQVVLVTGSMPAAARRAALAAVADGTAGIVIGTHALLEPDVVFRDLALVVIDEQHRFGVEQRDVLRAKAASAPHVLVMTATPIPRTVAMTVYGDLETSTLAELPRGRAPITSSVVPAERADWIRRMWSRVRTEVDAGHQAFVVCPRIGGDEAEESSGDEPRDDEPRDDEPRHDEPRDDERRAADEGADSDDAATPRRPALAVIDVFPALRDGELNGLRVEMLHGRLPADTKDTVMRRFARGDIDVLVATTVIEVGVDVPNATAMVVLDADRFGISQLHQLRGRVGRGSAPAFCLFHTEAPVDTPARERVAIVAGEPDGFVLARHDLRQRREGDVLGTSQAGKISQLRLLELLSDEDLILDARAEATGLIDADPSLSDHPLLAAALAAALEPERADYLEKA